MSVKKLYRMVVLLWACVVFGLSVVATYVMEPIPDNVYFDRHVEPIPAENALIPLPISIHELDQGVGEDIPEERVDYSEAEIALMARVVHAEAGNQDEVGKRLIVDVILNRVDSLLFPKTIDEVVRQDNQFSLGRGYTSEDLQAVKDEIESRTDSEIVFFRRDKYHKIGIPAYKYGDHYFSVL